MPGPGAPDFNYTDGEMLRRMWNCHPPEDAFELPEGLSADDLANLEPGAITHLEPGATPRLTGGSNDYYKLRVGRPTSGGDAYTVECNDLIEALGLNFAEGNILKAVWRHARARDGKGLGKPGSTPLYEAEKIVFFGQRLVELARR